MRGLLFDTDVLIWYLRGHEEARRLLDSIRNPALSAVTYMELAQGCRDKRELALLKNDLATRDARIYPIGEDISHRAMALIETHALSDGLQLADALIAATALVRDMPLVTGNARHFAVVGGLLVERFVP